MSEFFRFILYPAVQIYLLFKISLLLKALLNGRKKKYAQIILWIFFIWVNVHGVYILFIGSIWRPPPEWMINIFVYPFFGWLIASIILLFLYLSIDIMTIFYLAGKKAFGYVRSRFSAVSVGDTGKFNKDRRRFLKIVTAGLTVTPVLASGYAVIFNSRDFYLTNIELYFPNLPENLRGLKLAQVTDYHCSEFLTKEVIAKSIGVINDSNADIVLMTGDFVSRNHRWIYPCMETIKECRARYGVFAAIGNHDHWAGASIITQEIEKHGIPVLINRGKTLEIRGEKLNILGVDDLWTGNPDVRTALSTVEKGHFNILMTHNPDHWDDINHHSIDLTFAGHTHGGQFGIKLPGISCHLGELFHKYNRGLFKSDGKALYVNQGIGYTGPPIRIHTPPEITFVTLG